MPGDTSLVPSSIFGRISTRSSLMPSRDYRATVQLLDDNESIDQDFKKSADAQQILDCVCKFLKIVEKDYFGLSYKDSYKHRYWLDLNKPISKQLRGPNVGLRFRVRFYPSDVTVLKEEITRYQLFVQLQRDLLHGRLVCPQNDAAILGALILQSVIGDYDALPRSPDYVSEYKLLLKQTVQIEEKIADVHKEFKGLTPAEAELEFLKRASKLDSYGFDPYAVTDKQGRILYVGVTHRGIYIYHVSRKIHHITWQHLEKVDYVGKSLYITPVASYVSPYSIVSVDLNSNTKDYASKLHSTSPSSNGSTLKLHCTSARYAKHLWRNILSQQAFFTENDAKHIKPKFSKPRIPLLSRGSTFRYPTGRVLHEIELDGFTKRDGPQPIFTRYTLQKQPPRQQHVTTTAKYHTLPAVHLSSNWNTTIPENEELFEQSDIFWVQNMTAPPIMEEANESTSDGTTTIDKDKERVVNDEHFGAVLTPPIKWLKDPSLKTTFTIHLSRKEPLTSAAQEENPVDENSHLCKSSITEIITPVLTSTPVTWSADESLMEANKTQLLASNHSVQKVPPSSNRGVLLSALNVFFSFVLLALFAAALLVTIFETHSQPLDSSSATEMLRHSFYEPLRSYLISLYERFLSNN